MRALERLKDRTGLFVLAGCASDAVSYEATRYAQGLLTHSLLLGMKGGALREEEYVDVSRLFEFAVDQVPELAEGLGGVQRPLIACPKGTSFDLRRLTPADKERVPLRTARPIYVRPSFQEERRPRDSLRLGLLVDAAQRDASVATDAPLVFVDATEMPGAYAIWGRYELVGRSVAVTAAIWCEDEEVASLEVEGDAGDLASLAAHIVEEAVRRRPR